MAMCKLPDTILAPKDTRDPQRHLRYFLPFANLGLQPLHLHDVCEVRRHIRRHGVEADGITIFVIRCRRQRLALTARRVRLAVDLLSHGDDVLAGELRDELRMVVGDVLLDLGDDLVLGFSPDDAARPLE